MRSPDSVPQPRADPNRGIRRGRKGLFGLADKGQIEAATFAGLSWARAIFSQCRQIRADDPFDVFPALYSLGTVVRPPGQPPIT